VTFTHGSDTYTFVAAIGAHGKLTAKADHPITKVTPASSSAAGSTSWVASPAPSSGGSRHAGEGDVGGSYGGGEADD
jgi:hypothetical protein